ncbi:MAG: hypothetical protein O9340_02575 [Cyclobacteriaceae bacterium]|jgi:hypothetical protein|nr:hypothetical protein [Cyclobacteriaceae bacterium]
MKKICKLFLIALFGLMFSGCPEDFESKAVYIKNNSSKNFRYISIVTFDSNDTLVKENDVDWLLERIETPRILEPGDSVIILEILKDNLIDEDSRMDKYIFFDVESIELNNLSKDEIMETNRGAIVYLIKEDFEEYDKINFTLKYPKE